MIQEFVLILDGRNGVVLAFDLFGASVFGSRRSLPKGFQNDTYAGHLIAAGEGLVCPHFRNWVGATERKKGPGTGLQNKDRKSGPKVCVGALNTWPENPAAVYGVGAPDRQALFFEHVDEVGHIRGADAQFDAEVVLG